MEESSRDHLPSIAAHTESISQKMREIAEGVRMILSTTHNVVEGAGAMGVMAAMKLRDRLTGKRVAVAFWTLRRRYS